MLTALVPGARTIHRALRALARRGLSPLRVPLVRSATVSECFENPLLSNGLEDTAVYVVVRARSLTVAQYYAEPRRLPPIDAVRLRVQRMQPHGLYRVTRTADAAVELARLRSEAPLFTHAHLSRGHGGRLRAVQVRPSCCHQAPARWLPIPSLRRFSGTLHELVPSLPLCVIAAVPFASLRRAPAGCLLTCRQPSRHPGHPLYGAQSWGVLYTACD
jgi:hypothetical protein